jgi:hypothetical protein
MDRSGHNAARRPTERLAGLDPDRAGLVLLALAMVAAVALILYLERGTTFMSDEWAWLGYSSTASFADMFRPVNQHLTVLPLLLSKELLSLWGTALLPFEIVEVAGVLASGGAVYAFARPRVGPLVALAPAMVPMFLGTAAAILLQPLIGLQVIYSIAFGVAALVAVDRGTRGGDIAACVLVCLSLASFSIGIAFFAGIAVAVLLSPQRARRAYVFAIPLILYGAWRVWALKYGTGGGPEPANLPAVPLYYVDSIAIATTSLFGRAGMLGPGPATWLFLEGFSFEEAMATLVFAAIEIAFIVFAARRVSRRGPIPVMAWSTLSVLVTLWTIQGLVLVDGRTPGEPRYIYPGAVALALVVVAWAQGIRLSRLAVATVLCLTVVGIAGNLPRFKDGRAAIDFHAPRNRAYTGLMDLAGKSADPNFYPAVDTPVASPAGALSVSVLGYRELAARYGKLGYLPSQILEQNAEIRHGSDEVMVRMLDLKLMPSDHPDRRRCHTRPAGAGEEVKLPGGGAFLRADGATTVALRRFSDRAWVPVGTLQAGTPTLLRIPPDRATAIPWLLETRDPVSLTVCSL